MKKQIYYTLFSYNSWEMYIAMTEHGICYISSPHGAYDEMEQWVDRHFPHATFIDQTNEIFGKINNELTSYLNKDITSFETPIDLIGTSFQLTVWNALLQIPYGETRSYSQIAEQINHPRAVRAVGTAIGANPLLIVVPCHRVIQKSGALGGFRSGIETKRQLLTLEQQ